MALQTRKSNAFKPPRVLIYGEAGVGKTTFGAKSEKPVFITPEGGTDQVFGSDDQPVDEMPGITDWNSVRAAIKRLQVEVHPFKTLVIDSADWLERLCHAAIIGDSGKSIITVDKGYGAGHAKAENMFSELVNDLSELRDKRGMGIIFTAHAHVKQVKDPSMSSDYDSFEIKCHEKVASVLREWVDAMLFVRHKTLMTVSDNTDKARAVGDNTRVVYASQQPSFKAKNRYNLDLAGQGYQFTPNFYNEFMGAVKAHAAKQTAMTFAELAPKLNALWEKVPNETTKNLIQKTIAEAGEDMAKLQPIYHRLIEITKGSAA